MNTNIAPRKITSLLRLPALLCAPAILGVSAQAGFHLWSIQELYTNLDGTVQFIELSTTSGNQQFVSGQTITVKDQSNTTTHTFTIPANLPGDSANKTFLLATAGLQSLGGPIPDYTIPSNFLFTAGGTITFFGTNSGAYTALPTNGTLSRVYPGTTNQVNSPKNFAGTTGAVVPEPGTWALLGMGGVGLCALLRRRSS